MKLEYGEPAAARLVSDSTRTARAAGQLLDLGLAAAERTRATLSQLDIGDIAYGGLAAASALAAAHRRGIADAAQTVELLGQSLAGDADRLYQVAFAHRAADQAAADRSRTAGRT